ncbi:MAG: DUF1295 domain-containing protein [Planctomycetota bacterium]
MTLPWNVQLVWIAAGSALVMLALWALQLRTKDAGVVDAGWAACLGTAAVFCALTGEGDAARRAVIGAMGGVWGFRLATHLLLDRVLKGPEDGRYQRMREMLGARANPVFLAFFLAQAVLVVLLSAPFVIASRDTGAFGSVLDLVAPALWLIGLTGESLADRQLARFRANAANRAEACNVGLWRYSRHPNYFCEWVMWIAYAAAATLAPLGWLAWSAPALMLLFVLTLTGIPPTEARALRSRGDAYRAYQRTTNAFFPWFPRRPQPSAEEVSS